MLLGCEEHSEVAIVDRVACGKIEIVGRDLEVMLGQEESLTDRSTHTKWNAFCVVTKAMEEDEGCWPTSRLVFGFANKWLFSRHVGPVW